MEAWLRSWWKWALFRVKYRLKFSVRRFQCGDFHCGDFHCGAFTANSHCGSPARNLHCELSLRISSAEIVLLGFHIYIQAKPPPHQVMLARLPPPSTPWHCILKCVAMVGHWMVWTCWQHWTNPVLGKPPCSRVMGDIKITFYGGFSQNRFQLLHTQATSWGRMICRPEGM